MTREIFPVGRAFFLLALGLLPLAAGCDEDVSSNDARVQVQLTDAVSDYVETAEVWVSRVYLQGGPGHAADTTDVSTSGRVDLFNDSSSPFHVDLLTLASGGIEDLTDSVSVAPGKYSQLRIVVDSSRVTLKAPWTFEDGTTTRSIKIPSGSTSGIKVKLDDDLETLEGAVTVLLADFDLEQSLEVTVKPNAQNTVLRVAMDKPVIVERSRETHEP